MNPGYLCVTLPKVMLFEFSTTTTQNVLSDALSGLKLTGMAKWGEPFEGSITFPGIGESFGYRAVPHFPGVPFSEIGSTTPDLIKVVSTEPSLSPAGRAFLETLLLNTWPPVTVEVI